MGTIEAQRGRLGAFTDLMIYDVGGSRTGSGTLAISGLALPPGVEARATLDVRATAWTLVASWRALDDDATTLDAFAGARMLDVRTKLGYELGADVGPFAGPAREGNSQATARHWDAIGGVRGRARFHVSIHEERECYEGEEGTQRCKHSRFQYLVVRGGSALRAPTKQRVFARAHLRDDLAQGVHLDFSFAGANARPSSILSGDSPMPGTVLPGENAACSICAKKFSGLRFSVIFPTRTSG